MHHFSYHLVQQDIAIFGQLYVAGARHKPKGDTQRVKQRLQADDQSPAVRSGRLIAQAETKIANSIFHIHLYSAQGG